MHDLLAEIRQALRSLLRAPGFTAVALLSLALGIGATTAIFSVVYGVAWKALPYPDARRMVMVFETGPQVKGERVRASAPNFLDWQAQTRALAVMSARQTQGAILLEGGEPERIVGERVTATHFQVLGLQPLLGRVFRAEEDVPGSAPVCVLARSFWQRRFGGNPAIVGRSVVLDGVPTQVLGVLPDDHRPQIAFWTPLRLGTAATDRHLKRLEVLGRLAPGATLAQARQEFRTLSARLATQYPEACADWTTIVLPIHEALSATVASSLTLLSWAVGAVLLITCTNLANLLLSRAAGRQQDHAVRMALGATPLRVARTLLVESALLGLLGGGLGCLLALWGTRTLVGLNPTGLPRATEIGLHLPVLGFALLVSLVAGLAFGLLPAWQAGRQDLVGAIRDASGGQGTAHRGLRMRSLLVVAEVSLALVLMTSAGLLMRSFRSLQEVHPGFRTERLLTFTLPVPRTLSPEGKGAFQEDLLARLRGIPGVAQASTNEVVPLAAPGARYTYHVKGRAIPRVSDVVLAHFRLVGPGYFATLGIPVLEGRDVAASDDLKGEPVMFVNRSMAERLWPGQSALGQQLCLGVPDRDEQVAWCRVAGVVGDVRQTSLEEAPGMEFYAPFAQVPDLTRGLGVLLRTTTAPATVLSNVRMAMKGLDPSLPLLQPRSMEEILSSSLAERRANLFLVGLFAVLALGLTAAGVYGVLSFSVTQRRRELGVRLALGASQGQILVLILGQATQLVAFGLALGGAGSVASGGLLSRFLVGVGSMDPLTLGAVALLLLALAILAAFLPARRAAKTDPLTVIRSE